MSLPLLLLLDLASLSPLLYILLGLLPDVPDETACISTLSMSVRVLLMSVFDPSVSLSASLSLLLAASCCGLRHLTKLSSWNLHVLFLCF